MRTLARNVMDFASRQTRASIVTAGVLLVVALGVGDVITGYEISFSIFYLAPICFVTWFAGKRAGLVIAILSGITWFIADIQAGHSYTHLGFPVWNAMVRLGFFALAVILLHRLHVVIEAQAQTIRELEKARDEIRILSGFLPICSRCKKIRNDQGYWEQIESYIRDHSEAEFTHSICPECASILYPGLHKQGEDKRRLA
jgi:hypothetical protein